MANNDNKHPSRRYVLLLLLLLLITLISVSLTVMTLLRSEETETPEYPLLPDDTNAVTMGDDPVDTMAPPSEGGGAIAPHYSDKVTISLSTGEVTLRMGNSSRSRNSMSFSLIIQDVIMFESGLLRPGYELRQTILPDSKLSLLSEGQYHGIFRLSFYDDSGEKSIVQSEITVTVTVRP